MNDPRERTYVRPHDHCEVMVRLDDVYAYRDNLPDIPGVRWREGHNPLFRHADNFAAAIRYIEEHFIYTDRGPTDA